MTDVRSLLQEEGFVLLDGAMGTQLQLRGLKPGMNPEAWNLTKPQLLEEVHRAYLEAGSRIVYANTFGASKAKLAAHGLDQRQVILQGLSIARRAAAPFSALVAMDIGPLGELLRPQGGLDFEDACAQFAQQARLAQEGGADLIALETFTDLGEMRAALLGVKEACSLPVFATMSFEKSGKSFTGTDPVSMALCLTALGADAIGVNCGVGPADLFPVVRAICENTPLPVIVKANAGLPRPDGSGYDMDAATFARQMSALAALGVRLIGGCCGTGPDYIRALASAFSGGSNPLAMLQNLDPAMLQTIGTLFQEYNRSDDEKAALLRALQPFLRPERWAKVEKAIQITRLSRVIRAAMQLFREKGYV